jgi:DNA-binding Xre family transcriptional regulator
MIVNMSDGIHERIGQRMDALGLKNVEVARRIGVSPTAVGYWRNGTVSDIKIQHFLDLCDLLECSPHWLATGEGQPGTGYQTRREREIRDQIAGLDAEQQDLVLGLLRTITKS